MTRSTVSDIKRAQRESLFLRTISELLSRTAADDIRLAGVFITKISLSSDKSSCTVYFYMPEGASQFKEKLEVLKLYKPSLRKALAAEVQGRYTPEIIFRFDDNYEKTLRIEEIFEKIKQDDKPLP